MGALVLFASGGVPATHHPAFLQSMIFRHGERIFPCLTARIVVLGMMLAGFPGQFLRLRGGRGA